MSRKATIIVSLALLLLVAVLSTLFLQRHSLSNILEQKIISHIEDEIGRKIAFADSRVHIRPFYWQWNNAVLSDRKSGEVLLKAKTVRIYLDMDLGLLRMKVVSIRELRFTDPVLTVVRYSDGKTNLAGLFPKRPPPAWHVTIDKIDVTHGRILYDDRLAYRALNLQDVSV
ncbi:MAG: hypothetical protein HZC13_02980 [Nitrospirae bacterium]|nr:hypothetical protein [Nitrospirota bacterium]